MPYTFDNDDFMNRFESYSTAMANDGFSPIHRTEAYNNNRTFNNAIPNGHIRSDYNSGDYGYYRPSEAEPRNIEEEIAACLVAYKRYPIVSNIIDLMSDFGSQGVRIVCSDKRQEKFAGEYAKVVELQEFSARFLSTLYRTGTVIVKRTDGKVPLKIQKKWKQAIAEDFPPLNKDMPGNEVYLEEVQTKKAVLPLKWTIYNPLQVVMIGGLVSQFVGKPIFGLKINPQLRNEISQLPQLAQTNKDFEDFNKLIPDYVKKALNSNALFFPLDQSKIYAYYYKKDDWDVWGKTVIGPILRDLKIYDKLQLSDMSALDGAISAVRLWNMGNMEMGIVPNKAVLDKFSNILASNIGGGPMDIVWGPDLTFKESNTQLHQFLGPAKYEQTLSNIYAGLGIPPGLTGKDSSTSSSFTGLKTLVERLRYGRNILIKFLQEQLKIVQDAMGFTKPFKIVFDQLMMSDEAAEKAVLLQMWDRDIISTETLRYAVDIDNSDIEDAKIAREYRSRGKRLPPKASQFHNPEQEHDMRKIFAQKGGHTPSELGFDLLPKKNGEESPNEQMSKMKVSEHKNVGSPLTGRPLNSKDGAKRKKKRVMPKGVSANYHEVFAYAEMAKEKVDGILIPVYLSMANKKNIRSLSNEETSSLEEIKFRVLSSLTPFSDINETVISELNENSINPNIYIEAKRLENNHIAEYGRKPTTTERRKIECEAFANVYAKRKEEDDEYEDEV